MQNFFPNTIPSPRPSYDQEISDPRWLSGFISGEGCFFVKITKSKTHKTGFQVLAFQ